MANFCGYCDQSKTPVHVVALCGVKAFCVATLTSVKSLCQSLFVLSVSEAILCGVKSSFLGCLVWCKKPVSGASLCGVRNLFVAT